MPIHTRHFRRDRRTPGLIHGIREVAPGPAPRGRCRLDRLIERYGIDTKLFDWSDEITADCPRKQARNLNDVCGARCPDLSKVV
jgi:hypothetical protein